LPRQANTFKPGHQFLRLLGLFLCLALGLGLLPNLARATRRSIKVPAMIDLPDEIAAIAPRHKIIMAQFIPMRALVVVISA
jgi:hypothetical protein